jgi:hypothetical protein
VAVDKPTGSNGVVKDAAYVEQFRLRRQAAVRHAAQLFSGWNRELRQ